MKKWFAVCFASALFAAGTAFADPPAEKAEEAEEAAPAEDAAEAAPAAEEEVDCSALEGDEKTKCEESKSEAEAEAPAEEPAKGGKAQRSNKNRMESEYTDE